MSAVRRFEHGSRVPGWDLPVDLEKDPAEIPDPASTEVPQALREEIEAHMRRYPDRHSAALPALAAAQRVHGWCSPEALEQVACVMRVTPAYLESVASFYDMLETTPVGAPQRVRLHEHLLLAARRRRAVSGDPRRGRRRRRRSTCARSSASAPATSRRWPPSTASTSARSSIDRRAAAARGRARRRGRCCPTSSLRRRLVADPRANDARVPAAPGRGRGALAMAAPSASRCCCSRTSTSRA